MRICDQRASAIMVEVKTADGVAVLDAEVSIRDIARDTVLRTLTRAPLPFGGYLVLDEGIWQGAGPTRFLVTARRGEQRAESQWLVGPDSSGCHVKLLEGNHVLVLR